MKGPFRGLRAHFRDKGLTKGSLQALFSDPKGFSEGFPAPRSDDQSPRGPQTSI